MKRKGFTLIELLAVIVILAVIALIATPVILNTINKSRKEAFKDSAYGIVKVGELYYAEHLLNQEGFENEKTFTFPSDTELKINGSKPSNGTLKINKDGQVELVIHNGTYCATKSYTETKIIVEKKTLEDCGITVIPPEVTYKEDVLNGADPEVGSGMIPVTIDNDGTVKKADINSKWYEYGNKEWANVVTVTESSRTNYINAAPWSIIQEKDILTYLVWIPRYKYQLWNVNGDSTGTHTSPFSIQITFENKSTTKSNGTKNDEWLTHPAFTFGTEELNGYWVGKFETGYRQSEDMSNTSSWTKVGAQKKVVDASKVVIKPLVNSWRGISISNIFSTVQNMKNNENIFGLSTSSDTHMMKNMEWGAVAYLSHSAYGNESQIRINNNSNYVTGCSATNEDGASTINCENEWNTSIGYLGSTTGNITGIYDMSGGAWEYVMGYTTGATTLYGTSGFTSDTFPVDKYIDIYSSTMNTDYLNGKLGDSTKAIGPFKTNRSNWYSDYGEFATSERPWFLRGGACNTTNIAGAFAFNQGLGQSSGDTSFRVVVLGK